MSWRMATGASPAAVSTALIASVFTTALRQSEHSEYRSPGRSSRRMRSGDRSGPPSRYREKYGRQETGSAADSERRSDPEYRRITRCQVWLDTGLRVAHPHLRRDMCRGERTAEGRDDSRSLHGEPPGTDPDAPVARQRRPAAERLEVRTRGHGGGGHPALRVGPSAIRLPAGGVPHPS